MNELDEARLWEEESYKRCKNMLLTVITPDSEKIKKENCLPSPDSSHSPPQTAVKQSPSTELFHGDIKGMLSLLCFYDVNIARPFHINVLLRALDKT